MKKLISGILSATMIVGMALTGTGAADENHNALKFDDTVLSEGGGTNGYMTLATEDDVNGYLYSEGGMTLEFDFIYGHSAPCIHPYDATQHHTSKLNITVGADGDGYKYFGYNAEEDFFYLANTSMNPNGTEGTSDWADVDVNSVKGDGQGYLVKSATGLLTPGKTHRLTFEFTGESHFTAYIDGNEMIDFDLYDDMQIPMFFNYSTVLFYARHICCYLDNIALYKEGVYDPATGEGKDDYFSFTDFSEAKVVYRDEVDEETGETVTVKVFENTGAVGSILDRRAFEIVDPATEIYGQILNTAAEDEPALTFEDGIISKSGRTFDADLTITANPGFDKIELYLLQDPLLTVESVAGASGLKAEYDPDEGKLTITNEMDYTADGVIATITYKVATYKAVSSDDVNCTVQDFSYGFGADVDDYTVSGSKGASEIAICNASTKIFNYSVGDLNGDGKYNVNDVIIILKIQAKYDLPDVFKEAGDVNGDGRTNNLDVSYYLKAIAGWKGYTVG